MSIHIQSFCTNSNKNRWRNCTNYQRTRASCTNFEIHTKFLKNKNVCETILCHDSSTSPSCTTAYSASRSAVSPAVFSLTLSPSPFPKQITQKDSLRPHVQAVSPPQHKKCVCNAHIYYTVMWGKCKEKT